MLELATISLTIFSYVTEENDRIVQALHNTLGPKLKSEKLTKIGSNSQFGDPFIIYSYETDDVDYIVNILENFSNKLDERSISYLNENLESKLDMEERSIYLRLDKYKAYQDQLVITEGGDVIKVELSYNAYTKKSNSIENVQKLLRQYKLLTEE